MDTKLDNTASNQQIVELLQQFKDSFKSTNLMTPTQQCIAELSIDELNKEYELVQQQISNRSRMQRDLIVDRWNTEQFIAAQKNKDLSTNLEEIND